MNSRVRSTWRGGAVLSVPGLDLVEQLGQVAVGATSRENMAGHAFLGGHRQDHRRSLAVPEFEHLFDPVATGLQRRVGCCRIGIEISQRPPIRFISTDDLLGLGRWERSPAGR